VAAFAVREVSIPVRLRPIDVEESLRVITVWRIGVVRGVVVPGGGVARGPLGVSRVPCRRAERRILPETVEEDRQS
jgi:cob(I)alamin adenosyltransferase